jgi:hypothetical protein
MTHFMKMVLLFGLAIALGNALVQSADLPTISAEHLYYLRARGEHLRRFSADDMIEYCVANKIGGRVFDDLYSQLGSMRIDLAKLQRVEGLSDEDARVKALKKTYAAYYALLSDEAQKVQRGLLQEDLIAAETLDLLGRAQQGR